MPTIDEKVVEMRFDNSNFEKNVKTSMSTLDKLKEALNFEKSAQSLKNLQNLGNKINFDGLSTSIQYVSRQFSAWEIAGEEAIRNLTNKAVNMLTKFAKENSIDQFFAGFNKYEDKTKSVQTIMAATAGKFKDTAQHMEWVNEQLSKLNWFSDETSYSFVDMTNNIGKFTSAGVGLEESVTAMQGISTWAAISGAGVQEASRAMYNLSQALGTGSVKLIDWKSIENANMGTAEFKENVIKTAVELGTLKKKGKDTFKTLDGKVEVSVKNFNEGLAKGWFTSEVLTTTLKKYGGFTDALYEFSEATGETASGILELIDDYRSGEKSIEDVTAALGDSGLTAEEVKKHMDRLTDSSMALGEKSFRAAQEAKTFTDALDSVKDAVSTGWMQTFEYIFGDYLEAKVLWTNVANELYDVFAASGEQRNAILKLWHKGIYEFDEKTQKSVLKVAGGYQDLMDAFGNLWQGVKNIVAPLTNAFDEIFGIGDEEAAEKLINATKAFKNFTEGFMNAFAPIEERAKALVKPIKETAETVEKVVKGPVAKTNEVLDKLVKEVYAGKYGNGEKRRKALEELGYSYAVVQNRINELEHCSKRYEVVADEVTEAVKEQKDEVEQLTDTASEGVEEFDPVIQRVTNIQRTAKGIFALLDIGKIIISDFGKAAAKVFGHTFEVLILPAFDALMNVTAGIGDRLVSLREDLLEFDFIAEVLDKAADAINIFVDALGVGFKTFNERMANSKALAKLGESLSKLGKIITDLAGGAFKKLSSSLGEIDISEVTVRIFDHLADAVEFLADKLADGIDYIVEHKEDIIEFFKQFKDKTATTITNIAKAIGGLGKILFGGAASIGQGASSLKDTLSDYITGILENPDSILNKVKAMAKLFWERLVAMIGNFDLGNAVDIFKNGAIGYLLVMVGKFFKGLGDGADTLKKIPDKIVDLLDGMCGSLKAYQKNLKADTLSKISKAILMIAGAIFLLSFVDEASLRRSVAAIAVVMYLLGYIIKQKARLNESQKTGEAMVDVVKEFLSNMTNVLSGFLKKAGLAMLIGSFAVAVAVLVGVLFSLTKINWTSFLSQILKLVAILTVFTIAFKFITDFAKTSGDQKFNGGGAAALVVAIALAVKIMAKSLLILAKIKTDDMKKGLLAMVGIMVAIGAFVIAMNKLGGSGGQLAGIGLGMVFLAVGMTALIIPLTMMALMPWHKLAIGIAAMGALIAVITAAAYVMKKNDLSSKPLIGLAAALILLTIPLLKVGKNTKEAVVGLIVLAAAVAGLVFASKFAEKFATGLLLLAGSMITLGISVSLLGVGLLAFAQAIHILAESFPLIIDGLIYLGQAIMTHGMELTIGVAAVIAAIAAAIFISRHVIGKSVIGVLSSIIQHFVGYVPKFLETVGYTLMAILAFLRLFAPTFIDGLLDWIGGVIVAFSLGLVNHAEPLMAAVGLLIKSVCAFALEIILDAIDTFLGWIPGVHDGIRSAVGGITEWVNEQAEGIDFGKKMAENFDSSSMTEAATGAINNAKEPITAKAEEIGAESGQAMGDSMAETGKDSIFTNLTGMFGAMDYGTMLESLKGVFGPTWADLAGKDVADNSKPVQNGIEASTVDATTAAQPVISQEADRSAKNYDTGLGNGIDKYSYIPEAKAKAMARRVSNAVNITWDEHSPSRVALGIGKFFVLGLGNAFDIYSSLATKPASKMATKVVSFVEDSMNYVNDFLNRDMTMEPTISPVMDISNLRSNVGVIDSMFGGYSGELALSTNSTLSLGKSPLDIMSDNSDVVGAITELKNDISKLGSAMSKMQIVMDSGALVGEIIDPIDTSLGKRSVYRGRGL